MPDEDTEATEDSTPIIDEEGYLFGTINIIDALVILLVFAVIIAGLAVVGVGGSDDPENGEASIDTNENESETAGIEFETQYATIDAGSHPQTVVDRISEGDTATQNESNVTITDVYATPTSATASSLLVGIELETPADDPARTGDSVDINTDEYDIDGEILRIEDAPPAVEIEPVTVMLRVDDVDQDTVNTIRAEADAPTRELSLVTIKEVTTSDQSIPEVTPSDQSTTASSETSHSTVHLTVELGTVQTAGGPQFHSTPLRVGNTIDIDLGTVEIEGTISSINPE